MISMHGTLSLYPTSAGKLYPFFTAGDASAARAVVFIGGLTCGLLTVQYVEPLSQALAQAGWRLVIMHWSSAYLGYGTSSIDQDVQEMSDLVGHLRQQGLETIVIMGHSTGSQDVIHYLSHPSLSPSPPYPGSTRNPSMRLSPVQGGIMQAAVSDREPSAAEVGTVDPARQRHIDTLAWAEARVAEGKGEELIDRTFAQKQGADWQPEFFTAQRFCDLYSTGGMDDYFSTDLPEFPPSADSVDKSQSPTFLHPLSTSFGALSAPAFAILSSKDQFSDIPDVQAHLARWRKAAGGKLETTVIQDANHEVAGDKERDVLCKEVVGWLEKTFGQ